MSDAAPAGHADTSIAGRLGTADPDVTAPHDTPRAPDPNATEAPAGQPADTRPASPGVPGRETREREAAWRRGEERRHDRERAQAEGRAGEPASHGHGAVGRAAGRAFPALAENVRDYAIFLLDPDGVVTYWGEGARLLKWWTRDEAEGAHLRCLYPDGGAEDGTAEAHLRDAVEQGEYVGEGHRVRRDGSTFWAGVTLTALREADGTLLGFSKVTHDLTARRAADAALVAAAESERARAAAEAASAARGEFIATMSHEVRTPINAVLGYADLLAAELAGPLTEGQRGYVARLQASGRHLLGLVNQVLDLSRLEAEVARGDPARGDPARGDSARGDSARGDSARAGEAAARAGDPAVGNATAADAAGVNPALARDACPLGDVVAAALALVEPQARARGVVLADELGHHAAGTAYWGDEARVRQILVNLLGNAVKFAEPRGDDPARVTVGAGVTAEPPRGVQLAGEGPWVYVRVEDTGPGIPEDQRDAVFEPFVQVGRRHNRPASGAGLGLTISRRLARRLGGDVGVEGAPGAGATFVLWLPAAPVASLRTGGV